MHRPADRPGPVASSGWWEWICTLMKQIEREQRGEVNVVSTVCVCVCGCHISCINTNTKLVILFLKPTWGRKRPRKIKDYALQKQEIQRVGELWRDFIIILQATCRQLVSVQFYSCFYMPYFRNNQLQSLKGWNNYMIIYYAVCKILSYNFNKGSGN